MNTLKARTYLALVSVTFEELHIAGRGNTLGASLCRDLATNDNDKSYNDKHGITANNYLQSNLDDGVYTNRELISMAVAIMKVKVKPITKSLNRKTVRRALVESREMPNRGQVIGFIMGRLLISETMARRLLTACDGVQFVGKNAIYKELVNGDLYMYMRDLNIKSRTVFIFGRKTKVFSY